MESSFTTFFKLGYAHILDIKGIDHLLFIVALCATYQLKEWKKVAVLVTAFTIGHSLTLAMTALGIINFPSTIIEWLIPMTILLTAGYTLLTQEKLASGAAMNAKYGLALFFGLIHGMAFSNFFKSMLLPNQKAELVTQLLAFNIGVEVGQLIIIAVVLFLSYIVMNVFKISPLTWTRTVATSIILATFYLFYQLFLEL